MKITGLDLSLTSTGVAVVDDGVAKTFRIRPKTTDTALKHDRMEQIYQQVRTLCCGSALVVLESPAFAAGGKSASALTGNWWVVSHVLWKCGLPMVAVPPPTLKVFATGKGNASKDEVLASTIHRYAHLTVNPVTGNDEADALQLSAMGWYRMSQGRLDMEPLVSLPKEHTRALNKWPYKGD